MKGFVWESALPDSQDRGGSEGPKKTAWVVEYDEGGGPGLRDRGWGNDGGEPGMGDPGCR